MCGIVTIVPHEQAASILASGVQDLTDAAVVVSGATGANLVPVGQLSVGGQVLHVVVAGVGPLCPSLALLFEDQLLKSWSG